MNVSETAALAAWLRLDFSRKSLEALWKQYGSFLAAWQTAQMSNSWSELERQSFEHRRPDLYELMLKKTEKEVVQGLNIFSPEYPVFLKEISSPPLALFSKGDQSLLSAAHLVAVVGTRRMSDYGQQVLKEIIPALVRAGAVIVSGLAYGIDGFAHEIALEHGGKCLAVLAGGLDRIYPAEHRPLAQRILGSGGLLISEQAIGMPSLPQFFPARNRIISGLSKATLVIEAQEESGSLITAKFALDQNRDVYAVPGNIFQDSQKGTNQLIAQGASPIVSSEQLLTQLGLTGVPAAETTLIQFDSHEEQLVYDQLREPRSLDEIVQECQLQPAQISQVISLMELKGIVRISGMRYARA